MSQLFISHSSRNNAEAVALLDWLKREGWSDVFLDVDAQSGITAGERWERALNQAARRCEAVLFLVSRDWLASGWCQKEFGLAHKLNKRLFGLLIDDIPVDELPVNLTSTWQLVNLAAGRDHAMFQVAMPVTQEETHVTFSADGLVRLKAGLRRAGLDPSVFAWPPAGDPRRSPYPGLRPLEAEDAGIFFGREAPTIEALDRLRALREAVAPRLLCILGASGAGKSSFLRAGLWPRLARDDRSFLPLPVLRPERAAISGRSGMLAVLTEACESAGLGVPRSDIRGAIEVGAPALRPLLARIAGPAGSPAAAREPGEAPPRPPLLVLPIDQGEELFLAEGAAEAESLLGLLRDLLTEDAPAFAILMTIRSDAIERLQLAPSLDGIDLRTMTLSPMPRGVYGTIIEGPGARMRKAERPLAIDPALTRALLDDMESGGARDALPLLAFTLERLWLDYGPRGRLTLDDYEKLGRVRGSIEASVEKALLKADADPRIPRDRTARLALLRRSLVPWLAGIDPETGNPRRRVARRREIPDETRPLVDLLIEERLLAADVDPATGDATVEPAHEALLRQWSLLQGWLEEDFGALAAIENVRRATRDWGANGRDPAWLGHGAARLAEIEQLSGRPDLTAQFGPAERDYLAACRARAERDAANERQRARQRRWLQWGSLAAALVFAVLGIIAGLQGREAAVQRAVAESQRAVAESETARATERTAEAERQRASAQAREAEARRNQAAALSAISFVALGSSPAIATKLALAAWPRTLADPLPKLSAALAALAAALPGLRERRVLQVDTEQAVFSPDGKHILTADGDDAARVWDTASGKPLVKLLGHTGRVITALFSPDGTRILTTSFDGAARLWDAATGKSLNTLEVTEGIGLFGLAAFSPDGTRIFAEHGFFGIWDAGTGRSLLTFSIDPHGLSSAAFSPDGKRLLTTSSDKEARVWDAATGELLFGLDGHTGEVTSGVFSPDGTRIVTTSWDNTARLWNSVTGEPLAVLEGHSAPVISAAVSPDGSRILTASWDQTARLWDASTGKLRAVLEGHTARLVGASFDPSATRILTASDDKTARLWDAATGTPVAILRGHSDRLTGAGFSPDGALVLTTSTDKTVRVWDATNRSIATLRDSTTRIRDAMFSADGTRVLTISDDKSARVWDPEKGGMIDVSNDRVRSACSTISPDGSRIATFAGDTLRIWSPIQNSLIEAVLEGDAQRCETVFSGNGKSLFIALAGGRQIYVVDSISGKITQQVASRDPIVNMVPSMDGRELAVSHLFDAAGIIDAESDRFVATLGNESRGAKVLAFSHDGRRLLTRSTKDDDAVLWDATTGKSIVVLRGHKGSILAAGFSLDGTRIVTSAEDATSRIWDAMTGKVSAVLQGHTGGVNSALFSSDGARILTASKDGTARLWDAATGGSIFIFSGHTASVFEAVFSPDGTRVLTASEDGTARTWDVSNIPHGNLFQVACAWLPDTDLAEIATDYGLTGLAPICQGDVPVPDPLQH